MDSKSRACVPRTIRFWEPHRMRPGDPVRRLPATRCLRDDRNPPATTVFLQRRRKSARTTACRHQRIFTVPGRRAASTDDGNAPAAMGRRHQRISVVAGAFPPPLEKNRRRRTMEMRCRRRESSWDASVATGAFPSSAEMKRRRGRIFSNQGWRGRGGGEASIRPQSPTSTSESGYQRGFAPAPVTLPLARGALSIPPCDAAKFLTTPCGPCD